MKSGYLMTKKVWFAWFAWFAIMKGCLMTKKFWSDTFLSIRRWFANFASYEVYICISIVQLVKILADNWILGARRSASSSADKWKMGSESRSLRCRGGRSHLVQKVNCDRIVTYDISYDIAVIAIYLKYIDIFNNIPKKKVYLDLKDLKDTFLRSKIFVKSC